MRKSKDLYQQRRFWRLVLMLIALGIVLFSIAFTYNLARQIEQTEKEKVQTLAEAYRNLVQSSDEQQIEQALRIIQENEKIPVIWTSAEKVPYDYKNVDTSRLFKSEEQLIQYLERLERKKQVVTIVLDNAEDTQLLFYAASDLLRQVRIYPYALLILVALFLLITFLAFSFSRTAEQNQLWVGMAKETAHQLGTPLSSMNAWLEMLEDKLLDEDGKMIQSELKKDVARLEIVADRFSKIGSNPSLESAPVVPVLNKIIDYMSKRAPKEVNFSITDFTEGEDAALFNSSLFEWVLENLLKNALDAMGGKGEIQISVHQSDGYLQIDIADSGKGIPSGKHQAVFEPGFTTKMRGWGLGLTLTKRIIEQYHKGKIYVKTSAPGQGTTFRIELKKA